jgi:hypothetical protein
VETDEEVKLARTVPPAPDRNRRWRPDRRIDDANSYSAGLTAAAADALGKEAVRAAAGCGDAPVSVAREDVPAIAARPALAAEGELNIVREHADPTAAAAAADALGVDPGRVRPLGFNGFRERPYGYQAAIA